MRWHGQTVVHNHRMAQVGEVVRLVDQVLGPDHIGSYPHGSAVLGHLRPASDIDILTVSAHSLNALATGEILSKDAAANWALQHLPPEHRPVLAHARRLYLETSYVDEQWSAELRNRVGPHVDAVLAEIRALSTSQG